MFSLDVFTHLICSFVCLFIRENKAYDLSLEGGKTSVYCHMDDIPGCGSGGFTMIMKIDGTKVRNYDRKKADIVTVPSSSSRSSHPNVGFVGNFVIFFKI